MKHPGGRPLLYETPEELQEAIDEYFKWCDDRAITKVDSDGKQIIVSNPAPYTMSGLARRLGMDRRTLVEYAHRDKFFPTIKAARERVHEDVETRLMETSATGPIFNLKNNFGWVDKTESDFRGEIRFEDLTDEQLDKYIYSKIGKDRVSGTADGEGEKSS